jgi:hypothetical protein
MEASPFSSTDVFGPGSGVLLKAEDGRVIKQELSSQQTLDVQPDIPNNVFLEGET